MLGGMKHITSPQGIDRLVDTYHQHLLNVRGLAPGTCANYVGHVREFLTDQWKATSHDLVLSQLGAEALVEYFTDQRSRSQPRSLQSRASSLRSFLRFLTLTRQGPAELAHAVPKIQTGPRTGSPHYLTQAQLQQVLAGLDPQTPLGARDHAVIHCLADLGLRAGEVAHLVLEDFDWRQGTLRLTQTKGRRERLLPLPPTVGHAVVHYLQHGRPATAHRQVFVSLPDGEPLSSGAISQLTARALQQAHLVFPRSGAQLLRRTFATHLLQKGVGVKAIADLLGHRHLNNTPLYAHVNLPQLRTVAQPWPEGGR
jgi:site-specific recombinase XerD